MKYIVYDEIYGVLASFSRLELAKQYIKIDKTFKKFGRELKIRVEK